MTLSLVPDLPPTPALPPSSGPEDAVYLPVADAVHAPPNLTRYVRLAPAESASGLSVLRPLRPGPAAHRHVVELLVVPAIRRAVPHGPGPRLTELALFGDTAPLVAQPHRLYRRLGLVGSERVWVYSTVPYAPVYGEELRPILRALAARIWPVDGNAASTIEDEADRLDVRDHDDARDDRTAAALYCLDGTDRPGITPEAVDALLEAAYLLAPSGLHARCCHARPYVFEAWQRRGSCGFCAGVDS